MKHILFWLPVLIVVLLCTTPVYAEDLPQILNEVGLEQTETLTQSMAVSEALTRITGTAIYPVFGLAFLGAWDHFHGVQVWYATPYLYIPLIFVMFLDFLKNTLGIALGPFKKIADIAFHALDFLNAHLGLFMSIGIAANSFYTPVQDTATAMLNTVLPVAEAANTGLSELPVTSLLLLFFAGLCGAAIYLVLWIVTHSFALLILLSPFSSLDALLRGFQFSAVFLLGLAFLIFPPLAVLIASAYIGVALLLFRWCWSYFNFASTMLTVFLFKRGKSTLDLEKGIHCFSDDGLTGCPERSKGLLRMENNQLFFQQNTLFGHPKVYPISKEQLVLQSGVLYPTLLRRTEEDTEVVLVFTARVRGREQQLSDKIGCSVEANTLARGLKEGLQYIQKQRRLLFSIPSNAV